MRMLTLYYLGPNRREEMLKLAASRPLKLESPYVDSYGLIDPAYD